MKTQINKQILYNSSLRYRAVVKYYWGGSSSVNEATLNLILLSSRKVGRTYTSCHSTWISRGWLMMAKDRLALATEIKLILWRHSDKLIATDKEVHTTYQFIKINWLKCHLDNLRRCWLEQLSAVSIPDALSLDLIASMSARMLVIFNLF